MIVVVDCETTGLKAGYHDLIQFTAIALTQDFAINKEMMPFNLDIRPKHPERADPEALKVNKRNIDELMATGIEAFKAADLFDEWFKRLRVEKIQPLGHNYATFDKLFIEEWLGAETFKCIFDYHYRDTCPVANYWIDRSRYHSSPDPLFPYGLSLRKMAKFLGVEVEKTHNSFDDCILCAESYKKMMNLMIT